MRHDWKQQQAESPGRRLFFLALLTVALPTLAQAQETRRFDLTVKAGELPKEQRLIRVKQGEAVEFRWTSDLPIRLHLHGYDILVAINPGEPTVTAFNARIGGRFPMERLAGKDSGHQHGGKVLYFEVHP